MNRFIAYTEFGELYIESNQELKTLILYQFDGILSEFRYHSVSTKELKAKNTKYLCGLARAKTDTGFCYNANGVAYYRLHKVLDNPQ